MRVALLVLVSVLSAAVFGSEPNLRLKLERKVAPLAYATLWQGDAEPDDNGVFELVARGRDGSQFRFEVRSTVANAQGDLLVNVAREIGRVGQERWSQRVERSAVVRDGEPASVEFSSRDLDWKIFRLTVTQSEAE
jgi:hypothetical protein